MRTLTVIGLLGGGYFIATLFPYQEALPYVGRNFYSLTTTVSGSDIGEPTYNRYSNGYNYRAGYYRSRPYREPDWGRGDDFCNCPYDDYR